MPLRVALGCAKNGAVAGVQPNARMMQFTELAGICMARSTSACNGCRDDDASGLSITMAFQPIADLATQRVFAYEALVRGADGAGADVVLSQLTESNRYGFDQQCRTTAIELASRLGVAETGAYLSINFLPNAVYEPRACIRQTLETASRTGFPLDRIIFEFTEQQNLDAAHVLRILRTYREIGFKTAIDDFGAGYAGLNLLCQFQPDFVKIDMELIRGIDQIRQTIGQHTRPDARAGHHADLRGGRNCRGVRLAPRRRCRSDAGLSDCASGHRAIAFDRVAAVSIAPAL